MQLTRQEERVVGPLLKKDAEGRDALSGFLFVFGLFVLGAGIVMLAAGLARDYGGGLIVSVVGLIVIEHAWNWHDRHILARVVQKYDVALRRMRNPEEEEVTR